jgi:hypothetical protein
LISVGAHHTLFVIGDLNPVFEKLHELGLPRTLKENLRTFPVYLGLPWGISFGANPNFPISTPIHIRVCKPFYFFEPDKNENSRAYVDHCYDELVNYMQHELDRLIETSPYKKT